MMLCCFLSLHARPCPARPRAARAGPVPVPISLFLFMRRNVASEGKGSGVTRAVKTNSLLRQWQLWCPWLSRDSEFKSELCLGAPLITEEVARAEGDGRSWRMDATAFEFVYLSFVNSMFLSTFALLSSVRSFGCLFIYLFLACVPPFPNPIAIAAPILRLRLVNIPLPIEFVSIYLLHRQNGANFVCAMRPITT